MQHAELLRALIEEIGVELSESNTAGESSGLCAFHDDRDPSLSVNVERGVWFCHAEGLGGGPVEFYASAHGLSPAEARSELARRFGYEAEPEDAEAEANLELLDRYVTACQQGLTDEQRELLRRERGLDDEQVGRHRIGYCPGL